MPVHPIRKDLCTHKLAGFLANHVPNLPNMPRLPHRTALQSALSRGWIKRHDSVQLRSVVFTCQIPDIAEPSRCNVTPDHPCRNRELTALHGSRCPHTHYGMRLPPSRCNSAWCLQTWSQQQSVLACVWVPPIASRIVNFPPSSVWIRNALPLPLMASITLAPCSLLAPCARRTAAS